MAECNECGGELIEDESKHEVIRGGRGGDTYYHYYTCSGCETEWTLIRDRGGLGGHGSFWHKGHLEAT